MSTRRERLERKLEKRLEWAESRERKTEQEYKKSDLSEERSGIPLGQPILVGHHSEKRHRRAIERADNAMRRSQEHRKMSEHHRTKAAGIRHQLNKTIFSDDEDAIEQLERKIEKLENERKQNNAVNKIIRKKPKGEATPEKIEALVKLGLKEETAKKLFSPDFCGRIGIPSFCNQNLSGRIRQAKSRIVQIRRQKERKEAAEKYGGISIEGDTWISVTFAEKPEREVLKALKAAGFRWSRGSWTGRRENLPECLTERKEL
jgi:hypothetical protein